VITFHAPSRHFRISTSGFQLKSSPSQPHVRRIAWMYRSRWHGPALTLCSAKAGSASSHLTVRSEDLSGISVSNTKCILISEIVVEVDESFGRWCKRNGGWPDGRRRSICHRDRRGWVGSVPDQFPQEPRGSAGISLQLARAKHLIYT
jgi:hypothetical protein